MSFGPQNPLLPCPAGHGLLFGSCPSCLWSCLRLPSHGCLLRSCLWLVVPLIRPTGDFNPTGPESCPAYKQKGGGSSSAFTTILNRSSLLGAENCVLGCLGHAEFHHALGGDVNLRAGGRVAADARFPVHQHQLAQPRNREAVFGVLVDRKSTRLNSSHLG